MFVGNIHHVGDAVQMLLAQRRVIDDNRVVEVAALDKICLKQIFNLADKDKCAARGYLFGEIAYMLKCGILVAEYRRVVIDFDIDRELIVGEDDYLCAGFFVADLDFVAHDKKFLVCLLFLQPYFFDFTRELDGTAVKNGHLGSVELYKNIIHTCGIEGSHTVFYGADCDIAAGNHSTAVSVDDVFCHSLYHRHTGKIHTLEGVAVVFGRGQKGGFDIEARMKALAAHYKGIF